MFSPSPKFIPDKGIPRRCKGCCFLVTNMNHDSDKYGTKRRNIVAVG